MLSQSCVFDPVFLWFLDFWNLVIYYGGDLCFFALMCASWFNHLCFWFLVLWFWVILTQCFWVSCVLVLLWYIFRFISSLSYVFLSFLYSMFSSLIIRFSLVFLSFCVPLCVFVFCGLCVCVFVSGFSPLCFIPCLPAYHVYPCSAACLVSPAPSCSLAPYLVCFSSTPVSSSFHRFLFYSESLAYPVQCV